MKMKNLSKYKKPTTWGFWKVRKLKLWWKARTWRHDSRDEGPCHFPGSSVLRWGTGKELQRCTHRALIETPNFLVGGTRKRSPWWGENKGRQLEQREQGKGILCLVSEPTEFSATCVWNRPKLENWTSTHKRGGRTCSLNLTGLTASYNMNISTLQSIQPNIHEGQDKTLNY